MTITAKIEGMSCGHCVSHVKEALESIKEVRTVTVKLETGTATIDAASEIDPQKIHEVIDEAGYTVVDIK